MQSISCSSVKKSRRLSATVTSYLLLLIVLLQLDNTVNSFQFWKLSSRPKPFIRSIESIPCYITSRCAHFTTTSLNITTTSVNNQLNDHSTSDNSHLLFRQLKDDVIKQSDASTITMKIRQYCTSKGRGDLQRIDGGLNQALTRLMPLLFRYGCLNHINGIFQVLLESDIIVDVQLVTAAIQAFVR